MRYLIIVALSMLSSMYMIQFQLPFFKHVLFSMLLFMLFYIPFRIIESLVKKLKARFNIPENPKPSKKMWLIFIGVSIVISVVTLAFHLPIWALVLMAFIAGITIAMVERD